MAAEPKEPDEITFEPVEAGALSAKQEQALQAVLTRPTLKEAASAAGVSEPTLWRYMKEREFSRRLREARREAFNHTFSRLQRASADAVSVLEELLKKEDIPPTARIAAARTILDYGLRAGEIKELREQVEELQEFLRKKQEEEELGDYYES